MTNSVNYPNQPYPANYSGVTIHITNPTVNANPNGTTVSGGCIPAQDINYPNGQYVTIPNSQQNYYQIPQTYLPAQPVYQQPIPQNYTQPQAQEDISTIQQPVQQGYSLQHPVNNPTENPTVVNAYPPQYYMNNYTYNTVPQENIPQTMDNIPEKKANTGAEENRVSNSIPEDKVSETGQEKENASLTAPDSKITKENDLSTSKDIIENLDTLSAEEKEIKKSNEQKKVVALTNEYIMSLENYLNNPNLDIRLMAAKEILISMRFQIGSLFTLNQ